MIKPTKGTLTLYSRLIVVVLQMQLSVVYSCHANAQLRLNSV